jgi:hypothetical protein
MEGNRASSAVVINWAKVVYPSPPIHEQELHDDPDEVCGSWFQSFLRRHPDVRGKILTKAEKKDSLPPDYEDACGLIKSLQELPENVLEAIEKGYVISLDETGVQSPTTVSANLPGGGLCDEEGELCAEHEPDGPLAQQGLQERPTQVGRHREGPLPHYDRWVLTTGDRFLLPELSQCSRRCKRPAIRRLSSYRPAPT